MKGTSERREKTEADQEKHLDKLVQQYKRQFFDSESIRKVEKRWFQ